MSLEPFPANIEQGIKQFAHEQHISHDEAVRKLLSRALQQTKQRAKPSKHLQVAPVVSAALAKVAQIRAGRASELVGMSTPNPLAVTLIGALKDEPDVVEAIQHASLERRQAMYGS